MLRSALWTSNCAWLRQMLKRKFLSRSKRERYQDLLAELEMLQYRLDDAEHALATLQAKRGWLP